MPELGQWHAERAGGVRGHYADRTGIADRHESAALRFPTFQIHFRAGHQFGGVARAPDAMLGEKGVDRPVLVRQRPGMRLRRFLASGGAPGFQCDNRQIALVRDARGLGEKVRIVNAFEIEQQQFQVGVFGNHRRQFRDGHVGIVAGGVRVAHAEAAGTQQTIRHHAHRTRLADHRDRAVHRRGLNVHR